MECISESDSVKKKWIFSGIGRPIYIFAKIFYKESNKVLHVSFLGNRNENKNELKVTDIVNHEVQNSAKLIKHDPFVFFFNKTCLGVTFCTKLCALKFRWKVALGFLLTISCLIARNNSSNIPPTILDIIVDVPALRKPMHKASSA